MARQNTATEKLVEQMLENISEEQESLMGEAKYQIRRAFKEVTGKAFEQ